MEYFAYGDKEIAHLTKKDKKLGEFIAKTGMIKRRVTPDLFEALIGCVISQQISNKAAETVKGKLMELTGGFTAKAIIEAGTDGIQKCGMSKSKAGYIMGIAEAAQNGLDFGEIAALPDNEAAEKLLALRGVGEWTVEMLLIFSLMRPDVVSYGDLAIRRGMMTLYGLKELTCEQFMRYRKRYSPYGTVASLYLWELANPAAG